MNATKTDSNEIANAILGKSVVCLLHYFYCLMGSYHLQTKKHLEKLNEKDKTDFSEDLKHI